MTIVEDRPVKSTRAERLAGIANAIIAEIDPHLPSDPDLLGLTFVGAVARILHLSAEDTLSIGPWVVDIERYLWLANEWDTQPDAGDVDPEGAMEIGRRFGGDLTLGAHWWAAQNRMDALTAACHLAGMAA